MSSQEQRRCPWCWNMIERAASRCEHCEKDVQPLESAPELEPSPEPPSLASAPAARITESGEVVALATKLTDGTAQILRWVTAAMLFGILLAGVALLLPAPGGVIALVLTATELGAAFYLNQQMWKRLRDASARTAWIVLGLLGVLLITVFALRQLGIVLTI